MSARSLQRLSVERPSSPTTQPLTRGVTRTDSSVTLLCTPFQIFSQRERDVEECHRRVGRVGPEHQSSRRGRGEQRRPLRRRVGNMGACPPPLRGRSAVVARNAACTSGGPKIDSHVDFDSTAAWRHHVSMPPSSRSQSAATTALTAGICELFRVKRLREIPQWWILGRWLGYPLLWAVACGPAFSML